MHLIARPQPVPVGSDRDVVVYEHQYRVLQLQECFGGTVSAWPSKLLTASRARGYEVWMKLYNADLSPNCLRVRAIIYELDLPVELVDVDLHAPKPADLLAANPNGKVPVLVDDDGFTLFESRAIN